MNSLIEMLLSLLAVNINSKRHRYLVAFLKGVFLMMLASLYLLGMKLFNGEFKEGDIFNILLTFFELGCFLGIYFIVVEYIWKD